MAFSSDFIVRQSEDDSNRRKNKKMDFLPILCYAVHMDITLDLKRSGFDGETLIVMPIVALPIITVLMIYVMFAPVKKESLGEDLI